MIGWGGNIVALMPGGLTGIRLAKSGETADNSEVDTSGMAQAANSLSRFCSQPAPVVVQPANPRRGQRR